MSVSTATVTDPVNRNVARSIRHVRKVTSRRPIQCRPVNRACVNSTRSSEDLVARRFAQSLCRPGSRRARCEPVGCRDEAAQ